MKKYRVLSLYNEAKLNSKHFLFDSSMKSYLPAMVDEDGNSINNDFITYYLANESIYDSYIKSQHGRKIFSCFDEDIEDGMTPLECWQEEARQIILININKFAGEFAKEMIKNKMQLGSDLEVISTYGARHTESTYGEDKTTNLYGPQSGQAVMGARSEETNNFNRSYELENIENVSKSTSSVPAVTDSSSSAAHTDTITKDPKIDEFDESSRVDSVKTLNDLDYYRNMSQFPTFDSIMKRIINEIVIEMGVSYDY